MAAVGMQDRLVRALTQFGFTSSDAKAYMALLKSHPATGYELTASSGIPRSAIYNVLRRLEALNVVNRVNEKPAKYVPLPPERLLSQLENRCREHLVELKSTIDSIPRPMAEASTWTLRGYQALIQRAAEMIASSEKSIYASVWGREARALGKAFKKAAGNGLQVVLFSFTPLPGGTGKVVSYNLDEKRLGEYWPHRMILVCDNNRLLVGDAEEREDNRAVVTDEAALVEMALSNLVLDITLLGQRLGQDTREVVSLLTASMAPVDEMLVNGLGEKLKHPSP